MRKPSILIVTDHFLPAYKAGGAVRTLANLVGRLGNEFSFFILTGDRDLDDTAPFPEVTVDEWLDAFNCRVMYLSPGRRSLLFLRSLLSQAQYDLIYLNSFFSSLSIRILLLRRLGLLPRVPVLLAPRGEFSPGALHLKRGKKMIYIYASRLLGLYRKITWQASSDHEARHIAAYFRGDIGVAPDLPPDTPARRAPAIKTKVPGRAEFVFVSRLSRKKNIHFALTLLQNLVGMVVFDIYGPEEDPAYVEECRMVIEKLPANVTCRLCGPVPHEAVYRIFERYHFFLFPTLGENFGHVILESLSAGCPVIISDQTYWQGLAERKAGWDIPLADTGGYLRVLQQCLDMDNAFYQDLSEGAAALGLGFSANEEIVGQNRALFYRALNRDAGAN